MKNSQKTFFRRALTALAGILLTGFVLVSCSGAAKPFTVSTIKEVEQISVDKLGRLDPIIIRFVKPLRTADALQAAAVFTPYIKGTWSLRDDRTIQFVPSGPYKSNGAFALAIDSGMLQGKESGLEGFSVKFSVKPSDFELVPDGLFTEGNDSGLFSFSGLLTTDIPVSLRTAADMVSARLGPKNHARDISLEWDTQESSNARRFTIRHISRSDAEQYLTLSWKGSAIGSKQTGSRAWLVPAKQDFSVLEIAADNPSCILVRFSDKLDPAQDIRGLVRAGNMDNFRYNMDGNILKLYNGDGWKADTEITILQGFKSSGGKTLMQPTAARISEKWDLPEVRFANDGVILPTTGGVTIPVETKNLRGLIVEAFVIYGDNILQFLQVNELDGTNEMRRVGEPVWSNAFDFNWDDGMKNRFVTRGLDLTGLIKKNPGGMIQLRVTFRKRHVMYDCTVNHKDFSDLPMPSDEIPVDRVVEQSYWNYYNDMDWETRETYWDYRRDPCHPAFYLYNYNNSILQRKNVLVSNLGIAVKRDTDGEWHIAVADIGSALPVAGANINLYTYAQKSVSSGVTDERGFINLKAPTEPYFITASKAGQTSYLRIDDGTALSVSHFPVDGEKAEKGIKGFIYGERGVWRPGDDIHLVFVLQDLKKQLPAAFPVTFELQDPKGRIARTAVYTKPVDGFYRMDTSTSADDPTGPWIARVKAGGQSWTRTLKIETVVPNRLAINLQTAKPYLSAHDNEFTLTGAWLHGAKAPGLKADVSAMYSPGSTTFDGYADYTFVNSENKVESNRETVWEGNLDSNSTVRFNLDLSAGDSLPGKLKAQLITRIFEPSGMFSTEQVSYDYSPYDRYVGIKLPKGDEARGMLLTDTKHRVDIAVVNAEGKPVSDNVPLSISVYKLDWRWWWEKDALTDASYVSDRSTDLITSGETTARGGRASWEFMVKYPDWGRFMVVARDKEGGHSSSKIVYIDWPGWAGRAQEAGGGSAAMLTLMADKALYRTGDTAQVSFSSGTGGRALVTVEKNGMIVAQDWLDTVQGTTVYKLPLTGAMAPNVYVHVTMLQKHMQTANSLPIRLYGVVPLMVEDPATRLSPVIAAPAKFEPGTKASLTVTESNGRPMTYTVAVVDEGLLGLTRFTAPNPWKEFYKKEASSLSSWDIYHYVMSAFGGKLETLLSIGGAEDGLNANNKKAERFKPVVLFFGPLELAAKAKGEISFDMPQYVGAVRVMVTAGKNGAYGTAEQSVVVKSDLMVQPTLPRTLGVNETVEVPVTLFNGLETARSIAVTLTAEGALTAALSQKVDMAAMSDKTVVFRLTSPLAGKAVIRTSAAPADGSGKKIEAVTEIDVQSRGSALTTAKSFTIESGAKYRDYMPSPGEKGTKTMSVELATLPVLDLETRLRYLIEYPYGCIEQITSGGFPQLCISDMIETSPEKTEQIKKNVLSVIERYPRYQTASGGFAYWPGDKEDSPWGTNYAGHFMLEARKAGYNIPDAVFKPWLAYQQEAARSWQPDQKADDSVQAYRLYTLALAGFPDLGAMNRLAAQTKLTPNARWLLAGTYALSGHQSTAADMTKDLELWPQLYRESGDTWGSNYRDSAVVLNTLTIMNDTQRTGFMIPQIAETFGSQRWLSTQETAWILMALSPYYRKYEQTPATYAIDWDMGSTDGTINRSAVIRTLPAFESPTQTIEIRNTGAKNLYGKVITRGIIPAGKETKVEKGLGLTVQYFDQNDRSIKPANMQSGDSFTVRVSVANMTHKAVSNVALSVPVPTCWEFGNERIGDGDSGTASTDYDYRDIRDTFIHTYFTLKQDETKTFDFHATVAYNGNYYVPAVRAEAMYDSDYQAVLPGQFVSRIAGIPAP